MNLTKQVGVSVMLLYLKQCASNYEMCFSNYFTVDVASLNRHCILISEYVKIVEYFMKLWLIHGNGFVEKSPEIL